MNTLWLLGETVVYQGPQLNYPGSTRPPTIGLHYAFYDLNTGEVWGRRISSQPGAIWHFVPGKAPDLRLPYEETAGFLPAEYMLHLIDYLLSRSV